MPRDLADIVDREIAALVAEVRAAGAAAPTLAADEAEVRQHVFSAFVGLGV